jgi:site-specific DNA-methyltransferase (adenine-specific)
LVQCDCLQVLPTLGEGTVDAILTDPPYGVANRCNYNERGLGMSRGKNWPAKDWQDVHGDDTPFDPAPWLSFPKVILWGANYYSDRLPKSGWLVWDKERPDELDQSTCELAWMNFRMGVRRFRYLWNGLCRAGEIGEHYHPTQKPIALMEWCLSLLPDAKAVFDPYMGSCPVGLACIRLKRRYVGCELHKPYFDIAVERCKRELDRHPLFDRPKLRQGELI